MRRESNKEENRRMKRETISIYYKLTIHNPAIAKMKTHL